MTSSRSNRRRYGNAILWIFAGTMHFVRPKFYKAIMPRPLRRWNDELVFASGVAELVGGVASIPEQTKRGARWWLLATIAAIYPANIQMALNPKRYPHIPRAALWARLPLQFVFAAIIWRGTE